MNGKRIAMALAGWLAVAGGVQAQLFGNRSVGQGIAPPRERQAASGVRSFASLFSDRASASSNRSSASSPSPFAGVGMPDVSARYMRGNREAGDFVGADAQDARGFVGMEQAENAGPIRSAIDDVRVQTGPDANRTQGASARQSTRMYAPRLSVDFDFARPPTADLNSRLTHRLESSLGYNGTARVDVSVEGGRATLRGEVASERDRKLARLLLLFEPGISSVQDDLTVKRPQPTPQAARSTPQATPSSPPTAGPENPQ